MTKQPDTPPTLIAWTADLANMAVSLRWGSLIDNPLLVLLTGIPVGATIHIRGPFVGADDADPDGSDQSVTSGEVIGWSRGAHRAPSVGTPDSAAMAWALLEISRIYSLALQDMDGRNTPGRGDDALDAIAEVLALAGVDVHGFPGGRENPAKQTAGTDDARQSLSKVITNAILAEDGRYIAEVVADYVWAAGYRKAD